MADQVFEVFAKERGAWVLAERLAGVSRDEAVIEAKRQLARNGVEAVRVALETYDASAQIFKQRTVFREAKPQSEEPARGAVPKQDATKGGAGKASKSYVAVRGRAGRAAPAKPKPRGKGLKAPSAAAPQPTHAPASQPAEPELPPAVAPRSGRRAMLIGFGISLLAAASLVLLGMAHWPWLDARVAAPTLIAAAGLMVLLAGGFMLAVVFRVKSTPIGEAAVASAEEPDAEVAPEPVDLLAVPPSDQAPWPDLIEPLVPDTEDAASMPLPAIADGAPQLTQSSDAGHAPSVDPMIGRMREALGIAGAAAVDAADQPVVARLLFSAAHAEAAADLQQRISVAGTALGIDPGLLNAMVAIAPALPSNPLRLAESKAAMVGLAGSSEDRDALAAVIERARRRRETVAALLATEADASDERAAVLRLMGGEPVAEIGAMRYWRFPGLGEACAAAAWLAQEKQARVVLAPPASPSLPEDGTVWPWLAPATQLIERAVPGQVLVAAALAPLAPVEHRFDPSQHPDAFILRLAQAAAAPIIAPMARGVVEVATVAA